MREIVGQMRPIFITAPTARNGVTLVQRLINSSRDALVFGERICFVETLPGMVFELAAIHEQMGEYQRKSLERYTSGNIDGWTSSLSPSTERMLAAAIENYYRMCLVFQQSVEDVNVPRWGVKNPMTRPDMLQRLMHLTPNSVGIVIYRDLFDVVRSAKARRFITNPAQLREYARDWQAHLQPILDHPRPDVLVVPHEALVAEPGTWIDRIEKHAGVTGIDRGVMGRRFNTFRGKQEHGHSPTGYIPPQPLTDDDERILREEAGPMLERLGYTAAAA